MAKLPHNLPFSQKSGHLVPKELSHIDLYGEKLQTSGNLKICSSCGQEIREAAKFCDEC